MRRSKKRRLDETKPLISSNQIYQPLLAYGYNRKYTRYDVRLLTEADLEILFYASPQIVSLWQTRQSFVTRSWNITGDEKSSAYQFIKQNFDRLNFPELAHKIQRAVLFGLSLQEIIWELLPEGKYFPKAFIDLSTWRFQWAFGCVYWNDDREHKKPLAKTQILATRYSLLGKDEPFGIMKVLANPTDAELRNEFYWDDMIRRNNGGVYTFYLGKENSSDKRKDEVTSVGKKVAEGRVAAFTMGENDKAELLEPKSKATQGDIYKIRAKALQDKMSKLILGSTLTSDAGANASFAIGEVHADTQEAVAKNDMNLVQSKMNELFRLIIDVNFSHVKEYPKFSFDSLNVVDIKRAQRDQILFSMGVKFDKGYIAEFHNIRPKNFEVGDSPNGKEKTNNV